MCFKCVLYGLTEVQFYTLSVNNYLIQMNNTSENETERKLVSIVFHDLPFWPSALRWCVTNSKHVLSV